MYRIKNATRNIFFGFLNKLVMLFFPFIIRSIMFKTIGTEALGLNSLLSSILQILNLAELGFGSAIVFSMYEPIAKKDEKTICALLKLYKKIYKYIGLIILTFGLALLPFLKYFIKNFYSESLNIYISYLLFLINTVLSYFLFAYKSSLLIANQRSDLNSNILTITNLIQYIFQILTLILIKNYYLYLIINIISTISNNLIVSKITDKIYPNYKCNGTIEKEKINKIVKRVFGLMIQKICGATRNSLDNIFISIFLGLNFVTIYSNYYAIISSLISIFGVISSAILASVGNSVVTESVEKNYKDMNLFNFIYMLLSGWCTIFLICLYQPFMEIWMGKKMLLPFNVVVLLCVYFYCLKMGDVRALYSDAKGLWWENKYRALFETLTNIILNYILGLYFGLYGIVLATLISLFVINFIFGSKILFKFYFTNHSVFEYFKKNFIYASCTLIICILTYYISNFVTINGILGLLFKVIICIFVPLFCYILIYIKSKSFKESILLFKKIFKIKKIL